MTIEDITAAYGIEKPETHEIDIVKSQRVCDNEVHAYFYYVWFKCGSILNGIGEDWTDLLSFVSICKKSRGDGYFFYMEEEDYSHFMEYWDEIIGKIDTTDKRILYMFKDLTINTHV